MTTKQLIEEKMAEFGTNYRAEWRWTREAPNKPSAEDFLRQALTLVSEQVRGEIEKEVEGMKKKLPKDPLDMTFREQMNQTVQPVYRPYVSNEESYNQALTDLLSKLREE